MAANSITKARPNESRFYYHFIKCGFSTSSTAKNFIPLSASDSLAESTTATNLSERFVMICPFDGTLERIWARSSGTPGSTIIGYHHSVGAGTEIPSTTATSAVTVTMDTDDTSYEFNFTGVTNTFSKGDTIMFSIDPTARMYDIHFMIVLKFDVST